MTALTHLTHELETNPAMLSYLNQVQKIMLGLIVVAICYGLV